MGDRTTQAVLGVFAGIFTYCLIVLRTIRAGDEGGFVPSLSVAVSVVLAIGGIGTLIFFIHHIASSIQASSILSSVANETLRAVDRLFPENLGSAPNEADKPEEALGTHDWQAVLANRSGYLQSVDSDTLLRLAREHQTVIKMERGIGEFVAENTPLASLELTRRPNKELVEALQSACNIYRYRSVHQDCGFGIRQLVDMALRALSPGINDTTTAVMCINYLTVILGRLVAKEIPSPHRYESGTLRVIAVGPTFASLVAESFDQIRSSAGGNLTIMLEILGALETVGSLTDDPSRRRVLREQAELVFEVADRTIHSSHDRTRFENRLGMTMKTLNAASV